MKGSVETRIIEILKEAKALAREYRSLTGRPLGVTGEVAEYEAVRLLKLALAPVRQSGYDAIGLRNRRKCRYQIKGRCILDKSKRGQRLGQIKLDYEWDCVLMVLLDENLDAVAIYEADRQSVSETILKASSNANRRGALSVSKFKAIGRLRWDRRSHVAL
jgi:hypothetical protein